MSGARSAAAWQELARRCEGLGYDVLLMPDHMSEQLAPIPALASAAAATTTLRVGSFVFANDYRNPVMLAKEANTLDVLSGGRLEFGLGAGWNTGDYRQLGIPYDLPRTRVERLHEAVHLLRRLWTEDRVTHSGTHYRVRDAVVFPRPLQRPHPPLMIAGGGPRILGIAARHAQIVALAPSVDRQGRPHIRTVGMSSLDERIAALRRSARALRDELELNVIVFDAQITNARQSLFAAVAARLKSTVTSLVESPFFLYGSRAAVVDQLLARRERFGISYVAVPGEAIDAFAPVVAALRGR